MVFNLNPVRNNFHSELYDVDGDKFGLSFLGQTASGVRIMPDIDYRFTIVLDARKRRIHIQGTHDGFPSYSILVDGKSIYDFEQNLFVESVTDLAGTGDVTVERDVSF